MKTAKHGLKASALNQIRGVLARYPQLQKAVLFGSRAKGTHERGSDIDLALVGDNVDRQTLGAIWLDFDDSSLPYRFSLVPLDDNTDPDVAAHIRRVGVAIYKRPARENDHR